MTEISEFHFLRPMWLIAIPILYWLIFISYKKLFRNGNLENLIEPHLLNFLATKPKNKRKDLLPWLLSILATLFLLALAGPVWEKVPHPVFQKTQARVIVLDLSYSMLASDIKPTRIDRVRFKLEDLLKSFNEGETGLISYAGDAFVVSPLTNDPATIISMLPGLNPYIMPVPGSNPDIAIKLAVNLIERSKLNNGHIILITDGIEEKLVSKIENILGSKKLSILAVGTESGSPIPLPGGDFLKDNKGNIVIPKLNKIPIKKLGNLSNISISFMSIDDDDIEKIISYESKDIDFVEDTEKRTTDKWKEEGPWLLIISLPLLSYLFRRGVLFSISLIIIFSISFFPKSINALDWDDLWLRDDQQAERLFINGKMKKASKKFKNEEWKGVAAYRSGDYENAIENFSKVDITRSTFNLANSYAKAGRLKESLEIYNKLLEKKPEHKDAKFNKELIEKLINEEKNKNHGGNKKEKNQDVDLSKKENQENNKGKENFKKNENTNLKKHELKNQKDSDNNKKNNEKQKSNFDDETDSNVKNSNTFKKNFENKNLKKFNEKNKASDPKDDSNSKRVENQVLEQWLRKIPDNPGRLLRNKMHFEFQRRGRTNLKDKIYW